MFLTGLIIALVVNLILVWAIIPYLASFLIFKDEEEVKEGNAISVIKFMLGSDEEAWQIFGLITFIAVAASILSWALLTFYAAILVALYVAFKLGKKEELRKIVSKFLYE